MLPCPTSRGEAGSSCDARERVSDPGDTGEDAKGLGWLRPENMATRREREDRRRAEDGGEDEGRSTAAVESADIAAADGSSSMDECRWTGRDLSAEKMISQNVSRPELRTVKRQSAPPI